MAFESVVAEIRKLDQLLLKAQKSNFPEDWASYFKARDAFEEHQQMKMAKSNSSDKNAVRG